MLYDDVRGLQQMVAQIPARYANLAAPYSVSMYQTADDGSGYPPPNTANTYFGYMVNGLSFTKTVGQQDLQFTVTERGNYILNVGTAYIPEGTLIVCRRIKGLLYASVGGLEVYYSEDGSTVSDEMGLDDDDDDLPDDVTFDEKFGLTPQPPLFAMGNDSDAWIIAELGDDDGDEEDD